MDNSSGSHILEDDSARIRLENGIIHFEYKAKVVDIQIQKKNITDRESISGNLPRPVFVDARKVGYWTREARDYSLRPDTLRLIKAIAFQYSSTIHIVFLNWILKFIAPGVPMKAFRSKEKALEWLEAYK